MKNKNTLLYDFMEIFKSINNVRVLKKATETSFQQN